MTPGGEDSPMKVAATVEKVRALALTPERVTRNIEVHLGSKRSSETRKLMSDLRKGMNSGPKTDIHRKNISASLKGKPNGRLGKTHSAKTKQKIAESMRRYHEANSVL